MKTLHIVTGSTGEYSDRREWLVQAHRTKAAARRHGIACQEAADALYRKYAPTEMDYDRIPDKANKFDPRMGTDYTGTHYYVQTCPVSE